MKGLVGVEAVGWGGVVLISRRGNDKNGHQGNEKGLFKLTFWQLSSEDFIGLHGF